MPIYTRTGDEGDTGLFGGGRVSKAHERVEAYGAVDELNAALGLAVAELAASSQDAADLDLAGGLREVQADLFALGAHLATAPPEGDRPRPELPPLPAGRVAALEAWIDALDAGLPPLKAFILPGGTRGAAALHLARTACRRAERQVVRLGAQEKVDDTVLVYLNRLSDLLFVLAREANRRQGVADEAWTPDRDPPGS